MSIRIEMIPRAQHYHSSVLELFFDIWLKDCIEQATTLLLYSTPYIILMAKTCTVLCIHSTLVQTHYILVVDPGPCQGESGLDEVPRSDQEERTRSCGEGTM